MGTKHLTESELSKLSDDDLVTVCRDNGYDSETLDAAWRIATDRMHKTSHLRHSPFDEPEM